MFRSLGSDMLKVLRQNQLYLKNVLNSLTLPSVLTGQGSIQQLGQLEKIGGVKWILNQL